MKVEEFPDRIICIDSVDYLYFGGTNYLGITTNQEFKNILFSSIKKWGVSYGSSRNANIKLSIYEKGEKIIAEKIKTEAALVFSSGMLAGKVVVDYLLKNTDAVFHFPTIHSALKNDLSLPIFVHKKLNSLLFDSAITSITVLTDSFPILKVTPIDLRILIKIPSTIQITLVIDESHSFGIFENDWHRYLQNKLNIKVVKVGSLGKAFGLSGGFIAGNIDFISKIKNQECFIGASSMNPAFLQTFVDADQLYKSQKQKLDINLNYVKLNLLQNEKILFKSNYPIIYFDDEILAQKLLDNKIIVASFNYLNSSKKLNRIVITANHTLEDLNRLIKILNLSIISESNKERNFD